MPDNTSKPRFSIVIEWENALFAEALRSSSMLQELRRQAEELLVESGTGPLGHSASSGFELLLVFDQQEFSEQEILDTVSNNIGEPDQILDWRVLGNPGGGYYKSKDLGARQACGEIIIFLDSDVIPEPYWLERMVSPLQDPAIQLLTGSSFIEPEGLVGKTFALTWFFPLRRQDGPIERVNSFMANNFAMRRSQYLEHPFPDLPGTSRGACIVLSRQLRSLDIPMWQNPRARVSHPAPNGLRHLVFRGLAQGRDRLYREREFGTRWSASWPFSFVRLLSNWARSLWRICTKFNRVKLNPLMIPAAMLVSGIYYLQYFIGEMMSHLRIRAINRVRV